MLEKKIKKVLKKKLNEYFESIDDSELVDILKDNIIVSGGAITSLLLNQEINDYDCYLKSKEAVIKVANYYLNKFRDQNDNVSHIDNKVDVDGDRVRIFIRSSGELGEYEEGTLKGNTNQCKDKFRPAYMTSNAITLSDKIQIVIRFFGEGEEILTNYDFEHTKAFYDYKKDSLHITKDIYECVMNKVLVYTGSKYPICSLFRVRKFIERGWTINAGQILKMSLQVNDLDLKDLDVLKDQLVGVDSYFFLRLIDMIEEAKVKNKDVDITSEYIITLINRIF